ncbi:MAG: hypothetical protein U0002_10810 [Thermoanaerobaculia bacterium]
MARHRALIALCCLAVLLSAPAGAREPLHLVRWVDSNTPVPGGQGNFFLDNHRPAFCELGLVFNGNEADTFASGIYRARAPFLVELLVNENTLVPGVGVPFSRVGEPVCSGSKVLFSGRWMGFLHQGLFLWEAGQLRAVVTDAEPSPHGPSHLTGFGERYAIEGSTVAFKAQDQITNQAYIFIYDGQLHVLAAAGDPVPWIPGAYILGVSDPLLAGQGPVFAVDLGNVNSALVRWGERIRPIVDLNTPVPDQPGATFYAFLPPETAPGRVAFAADTPAGSGIYQDRGAGLETLVPPRALSPEGVTLFAYDQPVVDERRVAFFAEPRPAFTTLYLSRGFGLEKVIATEELFDGENVVQLRHSLSQGILAVHVQFEGLSQAIYVADLREAAEVPALAPLGLAALAALVAGAGWLALRRRLAQGPQVLERRNRPPPPAPPHQPSPPARRPLATLLGSGRKLPCGAQSAANRPFCGILKPRIRHAPAARPWGLEPLGSPAEGVAMNCTLKRLTVTFALVLTLAAAALPAAAAPREGGLWSLWSWLWGWVGDWSDSGVGVDPDGRLTAAPPPADWSDSGSYVDPWGLTAAPPPADWSDSGSFVDPDGK